jgi:hypothetical protein
MAIWDNRRYRGRVAIADNRRYRGRGLTLRGGAMLFSARIKDLEAQVSALTTERDEAVAANAECQARFDADQATIATLTASVETLTAERDAAVAARDAAQAGVDEEVTRRIAAAGGDPINRKVSETDTEGGVLAQLEGIKDPAARTEFFRKNREAIHAANAALKKN